MDSIPMRGDVAPLIRELESVALLHIEDGSGSSHFDGPEGWIHGLWLNRIAISDVATYPILVAAIARLGDGLEWRYGQVAQVLLNKLKAGNNLDPHKDGAPNRARFHLPLVTHPDVYWWDELEGRCHMEVGRWYGPVPYCGILHSAGNPSPIDRVHVIVDFERGV